MKYLDQRGVVGLAVLAVIAIVAVVATIMYVQQVRSGEAEPLGEQVKQVVPFR